MQEELAKIIISLLEQIAQIDSQYVILALIIVAAAIVFDAVAAFVSKEKAESGVGKASAVSIDGAKTLEVGDYISDIQGLAGRPDAVISENGHIIPVERKPMSRKIRDRHVAQLLVYMRLIEEFEGKKPPYGYIILGKSCRQVKIVNSEEKQAWLQRMLDEMRAYLEEDKPVEPKPQHKKCRKCPVRSSCSSAILEPDTGKPVKDAPGIVPLGNHRKRAAGE